MLLTEKDYIIVPVKVFYLEMHTNLNYILQSKPFISFSKLKKPIDTDEYKHYYKSVGFQYNWLDRLVMNNEELDKKINAPNIDVFIMQENNLDACYAEFAKEKDYIEVVYFGLFPSFIGKGLGKFFLKWVVNMAWSYNPKWIQLNTCALDHPNALGVYQSVGFNIVKTTTEERKVLV